MKKTILNVMIASAFVSSIAVSAAPVPVPTSYDEVFTQEQANLLESTANIALDNKDDILKNASAIKATADTVAQNSKDITDLNTVANGFSTRIDHVEDQATINQSDIVANKARIDGVKTDQASTNKTVASNSRTIENHEQRLQDLEAKDTVNFGKLQNEVNENRQRASAAISGVAAMANIPQVIQGQTLAVGAGVGTTDGESALAVGFSARAAEHVIVKASVSDDSQQNFVVGGGVAYGW